MNPFVHERSDFKDLISALSNELKIQPQLVEKDYWLMHALWGLKDLGFDYELKGGTSLSKGWGCIDRFSEDIDILIHPSIDSKVATGKNQNNSKQIESRKKYFQEISDTIQIAGFDKVERDFSFDDAKDMRNAGIRLYYPNLFGQINGLKDGILLEVGFDQTTPNEKKTISSWISEKALTIDLDVYDNRAKEVKCYVPEYTFVEKLQTISTKYRQQQEKSTMPVNFMRHYYDVYQLLQLDRVKNFIGTAEYHTHKENRFRPRDEKDLTKNEAFILSNSETKGLYKTALLKTKDLYFKGLPEFDTFLKEFSNWLSKL
ncbi:MAG: nucleotidyl transferase AbiEii/AbiGii toxin family protein [Bdellovibrionaceae bacterium]|nr:nucleotidyl transferase AbiEii/AbiGii toxin family protein [Pseudobdellovibrionaceae bacterium]